MISGLVGIPLWQRILLTEQVCQCRHILTPAKELQAANLHSFRLLDIVRDI